jgi:hypothetical protein
VLVGALAFACESLLASTITYSITNLGTLGGGESAAVDIKHFAPG